jgi:putative nucleotidyltransferase with HDIG domain
MSTPALRRVVDLFYADDHFRLQLEQTPGSVNRHHAKLGGLPLHVFEVTSIARSMARTMNANADLVVAGALLHDAGKVEAYEIDGGGFGYTPVRPAARPRGPRLPHARAAAHRGRAVDLQ